MQCVFVSTDCICGHHIYEELWVALVRECLPHQAETENINSSNETGPARMGISAQIIHVQKMACFLDCAYDIHVL